MIGAFFSDYTQIDCTVEQERAPAGFSCVHVTVVLYLLLVSDCSSLYELVLTDVPDPRAHVAAISITRSIRR